MADEILSENTKKNVTGRLGSKYRFTIRTAATQAFISVHPFVHLGQQQPGGDPLIIALCTSVMVEVSNESNPPTPDESGQRLGTLGPYRVLQTLGKGGMGQVFLAEDTRLKRTVALKTMHKKYASSSISRRRFIHEARAMAAIKHDHVVTVYEVGEHKGQPFLAMELLKGESLEQRLQTVQQLPYREAFEYGRQIANGLAAAHQQGIIHRDIKPANLWLEQPQGRIKILDFGLAMAGGVTDSLFSRDAVVGTPAYLAPEQCQGETVDERCDLYSLGVVLYQLCCGKPPLTASTVYEQLIKIISYEAPRPEQLCADLPGPLADIIVKLLSKEPHDRYHSASEVERAIGHALQLVDDQRQAAMRIVTQSEPSSASTEIKAKPNAKASPKPVAASSAALSSPANKRAKAKDYRAWVIIGSLISATILLFSGMWYLFSGEKVASAPMKISKPQATPQVTFAALAPLKLAEVLAGPQSLSQGEQASFKLRLHNTAPDIRQDPKAKFAKVRSVAQVSTTVLRDGQTPVNQLLYPRRLSGGMLPLFGESTPIDIMFSTQTLEPGKYVIMFRLESLTGQLLSELSAELEIQAAAAKTSYDDHPLTRPPFFFVGLSSGIGCELTCEGRCVRLLFPKCQTTVANRSESLFCEQHNLARCLGDFSDVSCVVDASGWIAASHEYATRFGVTLV